MTSHYSSSQAEPIYVRPADDATFATYTFAVFTTRYPIEPHGRKRLVVHRTRTWSEIVLRLDGVELGRPDREALLNGVEYTLRDHSVLRVWIEYGPGTGIPVLYITRNGHPLPGSEGDPVRILWYTLSFFWVMGVCQIAFAMVVINNGRADDGIYLLFGAGLLLILLGILAWGRSVVAMVMASLLAFGELALLLIAEGNVNVWNVWRLILGLTLFGGLLRRGIIAVHDISVSRLPIRHPPEPMHHG
jgi:hypothetical protein